MQLNRRKLGVLMLAGWSSTNSIALSTTDIRIGFLVKQPADSWFQDEWRFAEKAAKDKGFTLIKLGVPTADKVMAGIDNLAQQHAGGVIICVPDAKLGSAVVAQAAKRKLKLMSVDDRLLDANGQSIVSVPHMGISAFRIGQQVGAELLAEAKRRRWTLSDVGLIRVSFDQLPTAKDRTDGAVSALIQGGFLANNVINAPQATAETEDAFDAAEKALMQNPQLKKWMIIGFNDETVLGAVRAAESKGVTVENMIGIGIGGSASAISEFNKSEVSGFYATVLISPKRHGYETAVNMFEWIKNGTQPPLLIETAGSIAMRENIKEARTAMGL